MKLIQKQVCYSLAAVAVVFGLAVVPVSADQGSDSTGSAPHSTPINGEDGSPTGFKDPSPNSGTQIADNTSSDSGSGTGLEGTTEDSAESSTNLHDQAANLLGRERQKGTEHSEAQRQKACDRRQANINKHTAQFATQAAKHLDTFNSIFTKLQAFYDSKGLNVTNYDALVADATAKQAAAQSAVDALKSLNVNIDCTQPDPASAVATIKSAAQDARTALQNYRTSLKNLVVALKGASTAQSNTTTDNTQTGGRQ